MRHRSIVTRLQVTMDLHWSDRNKTHRNACADIVAAMRRVTQRLGVPNAKRLGRLAALAISVIAATAAIAQNTPTISGGIGFFTSTTGGNTNYIPYAKPVLVAPLGSYLTVETRATVLETFFSRASKGYQHSFFKTMDYLQADVFAGPHLTLVGGEFLTPFGTYNERLTQIWMETFQDLPLVYGVGTMNTGSSVGGMIRGSAASTPRFSLDYAAYYSGNSTNSYFGAERSSGGKGEVYLPAAGLEIGASYGRSLAGTHENFEGMHLWWQPIESGFRFRSEYGHAPNASGYWLETDYRLSRFGGADSALGRLEPVFRLQQTFRGKQDSNDGLPSVDTQRADFGLDYHLPHELRIDTSYSRQFSSRGDVNIWETGIVYRILLPAWKGHLK